MNIVPRPAIIRTLPADTHHTGSPTHKSRFAADTQIVHTQKECSRCLCRHVLNLLAIAGPSAAS